jgi:hypothetical protein
MALFAIPGTFPTPEIDSLISSQGDLAETQRLS